MVMERNYVIRRVPAQVLTLGTDKRKPDEWSSTSLDARESKENSYESSMEKSLIGNGTEFENYARLYREPTSNECGSSDFSDQKKNIAANTASWS